MEKNGESSDIGKSSSIDDELISQQEQDKFAREAHLKLPTGFSNPLHNMENDDGSITTELPPEIEHELIEN